MVADAELRVLKREELLPPGARQRGSSGAAASSDRRWRPLIGRRSPAVRRRHGAPGSRFAAFVGSRWSSPPDRKGSDVRLLTVDEIGYFRSDTKHTRAATPELEALIRKSLKELLDELDPTVFWQIHRSTIVNVNAIGSLSRDFRGRLAVKLKSRPETLPVSEAFEHLFRQM